MPPNYATILYHKQVIGCLEPVERVVVRERGAIVVGAWDITVCYDYHGIAGYQQNPPYDPKAKRPARKVVAASATHRS